MSIAHDANTRFPTTENTEDVTTGDRTFTHTPVGIPAAIVVAICGKSTTLSVTGILYGGVAMTSIVSATDTSEAGRCDIYALVESDIPTGAQTVTLQGCTATSKFCTCNSVTASRNAKVNVSGAVNTTTSADPQVSLVTTEESVCYGALHTGNTSPSAVPLTGVALQNNRDYGNLAAQTIRRTSTEVAGTRAVGVTLVSDDWCAVAVAIQEYGPSTITMPRYRYN